MIEVKKYKKKPEIIEAIQFTREMAYNCLTNHISGPFGLFVAGSWNIDTERLYDGYINIRTPKGTTLRADLDDWIIKGINGELQPCKPDDFAAIYEPV